jgi:hypothetical protein
VLGCSSPLCRPSSAHSFGCASGLSSRSCCHSSSTTPLDYGRATAATLADDPHVCCSQASRRIHPRSLHRPLPSPAGAIDTRSTTRVPQPPASSHHHCARFASLPSIRGSTRAKSGLSFFFDLLKRECFSLCPSRDVGMPKRPGLGAGAADAVPVTLTRLLRCKRLF